MHVGHTLYGMLLTPLPFMKVYLLQQLGLSKYGRGNENPLRVPLLDKLVRHYVSYKL